MKIKLFNVAFFITALLAILANVYEEKLCLLWLQVLVIPNVKLWCVNIHLKIVRRFLLFERKWKWFVHFFNVLVVH